ncbi:MAG TPA: class I SAM-dependent methyltransferase [Candidatus Saccharimonadales bacterium]|jgi:SAM-dependent methyltransferase
MDRKVTIETYDRYAQIYDEEVVEFWDNFPREFLARFRALTTSDRVLNVGSGSGRDALLLRDLGLEVTCVDGSHSMVKMTQSQGLDSYHADFADIDFPAESFGGIWAYTSLIHVPKEEAASIIGHLHTLLASGGTFAIGVIEGMSDGMVERRTMPGAGRYFKNYIGQELTAMIEPIGFQLAYESSYQPHSNVYLNQIYTKTVSEQTNKAL